VIPTALPPILCIGIDVAKSNHHVAFISKTLLQRYKHFPKCPARKIGQSRAEIEAMLQQVRAIVPLSRVAVLMEETGHYHRALAETLMEEGVSVYVIGIHAKKVNGLDKTDRFDALRLANMLYNQVVLGQQVENTSQRVERRLPAVPVAAALAPLVRMHYELTQHETRTKNKLTALADELFPELCQVFQDVNLKTSLELRARFPTPALVAAASVEELQKIRHGKFPSLEQITRVRELAAPSPRVSHQRSSHLP